MRFKNGVDTIQMNGFINELIQKKDAESLNRHLLFELFI